ncbi:MAG: hypothetical protein RRY09_07595 [Oscillospiraceae bacterium]
MKNVTHDNSERLFHIVIAVALILLACGLGIGAYSIMAPSSYVSMDVNPSIEYTLNTFDRVLSVNAVNEDGAQILQELNLKDFNNATIDEAIAMTLTKITEEGYFDGNAKGGVVIATSGKEGGEAELLAEHLRYVVSEQCAANKQDVSVEALSVNQAQLDEAKALGVTPGKLILVQKLQAENPNAGEISLDEWLKRSVKDIMAETERLDELNDDEDDAAEDAEDEAEDKADALEDAEDAAAEAAEDKAEAAREALEDAEEAAEKAKDEAAEAADKARDEADKAKDAAEEAKDIAEDAKEAAAEAAKDAAEAADIQSPTEPPEAEDAAE